MSSDTPSIFLPALTPLPDPDDVLASLQRLTAWFTSSKSTVVDLRPSVYTYSTAQTSVSDAGSSDNTVDAFELGFARGWLEKVLALSSKALVRSADQMELWGAALDAAAGLLADMSGPSAQGSTTQTYLLPDAVPISQAYPTPPPTRPGSTVPFLPRGLPTTHVAPVTDPASPLSLTIRDGTLLEASTGHRTWGSASILSHLLAATPSRFPFIPILASASRPLRVLELGSGTGLVGLTAAAVLSRLGARAEVVLSDGGDEPEAVLANLHDNVSANATVVSCAEVQVRVERLDWRDYMPSARQGSVVRAESPPLDRFDLLLGTDLVYERGQATLLYAAAAGLLRFPGARSQTATLAVEPSVEPTFWLVLPLRPTHRDEAVEVATLFPDCAASSSSSAASAGRSGPSCSASPKSYGDDPSLYRTDPATGKTYRLVALERDEFLGPSGFETSRGIRGGRGEMGEMRYCLLKVGWVLVHA